MDLQLRGKTALITGSSSGIGRGCAEVLAAEGCNIVVTSRSLDKARVAAEDLHARHGVRTVPVAVDVSSEEGVESMFDEARDAFGSIDYLVNNAGGAPGDSKRFFESFAEYDSDYWDAMIRLNLYSAFWASRRLARDLIRDRKGGAIVNVTSKSAILSTSVGNEHYASAKAGMIGLTRSCAKELISKGIRVNAIIPGYVATEHVHRPGDKRTEEKRKILPTGQFATPLDMGYATAFLLSPLAGQINGALMDCTGGTLV